MKKPIPWEEKTLIAYLIAFSVLSFFALGSYVFSDEGTHLLLSEFYRDLAGHVIATGNVSFAGVYDYALSYLVVYPKLQIAYPPVFHLTTAAVFSFLGSSTAAGRVVSLLYAVGSFVLLYLLVKRWFGSRPALFATLLFSATFYSLFYATRALQDFAMYFWLFASLLAFDHAVQRDSVKLYAAAGVFAALSALSKQMGGIVLAYYLLHFLLLGHGKNKIRNFLTLLLPFLVFVVPYLAVLQRVGGFEINQLVATVYASGQGEPTALANPFTWLYYIIQPTITVAPFTLLLAGALITYIAKKKPRWKEFAIFSLIFYVVLTVLPNKEVRFSQLILLPAFVIVGEYASRALRRSVVPRLFLAVYIVVALFFVVPTFVAYPHSVLAERIVTTLPDDAAVAVLSDDEPAYSSAIMWELASRDVFVPVYRSCAFGNLDSNEFDFRLKENGIYYVVYSEWSSTKEIEKIRDRLELAFAVEKNGLRTSVYRYTGFADTPSEERCNYICLTGERICANPLG